MNIWLIIGPVAGAFVLLLILFRFDLKAVIDRDPASRGIIGFFEILLSYSGFHSIVLHRITHVLYVLRIPLLPRLLSQLNRFLTGIEIHPAVKIGRGFFIDHGMGVVIGETVIIGRDVTLFQGVTLGGTGKEKGKRHPTLGNDIVVGAGAKVLGNIVIGNHVKIGANAVVLSAVPDNSTVVGVPGRVVCMDGERTADLNHQDIPDPVASRLKVLQKEIDAIAEKLDMTPEERKVRDDEEICIENF